LQSEEERRGRREERDVKTKWRKPGRGKGA